MSKFKVWAEIEEIDEKTDYYEKVGEPIEMGYCDTLEEAEKIIRDIDVALADRKVDGNCPKCGQPSSDAGSLTVDNTSCLQLCHCENGHSWWDTYNLVSSVIQ